MKPELCSGCQKQKCQCPAFTPEMPCSSASSTPTKVDSDQNEIPKLVPDTPWQQLYPPVLSPSDEEADREVAAICKAPIYYRVRSRNTKRRRYYTYDALDYIAEQHIMKRQHYSPFPVTGTLHRTLKYEGTMSNNKGVKFFKFQNVQIVR